MQRDNKSFPGNPKNGFSLIELIAVMAIIGILVSIAMPSYSQYIQKQRRVDAHHLLLENRSKLTRCFTFAGSYTDCRIRTESKLEFYTLNSNITPTSWTLTAVPAPNSTQVKDTACSSFSLDNLDEKSATGDTPDQCWH